MNCPLHFDADRHLYTLRGVPVPSVTQTLKHTGYIRLDGIPADVLARARDRGQRVHQALHYLFDDDLDESSIDDDIRGYLQSAQAYIAAQVPQVFRAEFKVWSERHAFAGTVDFFALHRDGALFVGDFKTGDPTDVAADLQLSAYQGAILEMRADDGELNAIIASVHRPSIKRRSVRLFKDGRPARETLYTDHRDYGRFINALSVVHDQSKRPMPIGEWDDER